MPDFVWQMFLFFLVALTTHQCHALNAKFCYGPDGIKDLDLLPCDPTAKNSACCHSGEFCYDNYLCGNSILSENTTLDPAYAYYGCTDIDLRVVSCLRECLNFDGSTGDCPDFGVSVPCVCYPSSCICAYVSAHHTSLFTVPVGTLMTRLEATTAASITSSGAHVSTAPITPLTSASMVTTTLTVALGQPSAAGLKRTTTLPLALGIGIGALIGIGGLLVGLVLWRRAVKKRRQDRLESVLDNEPQNPLSNEPIKHSQMGVTPTVQSSMLTPGYHGSAASEVNPTIGPLIQGSPGQTASYELKA